MPGSPSDADSTGAVLQAVSGRRSVRRAIRYLRRAQVAGGGFRLGGSGVVNSQSTAWAAQGMLAAGVRPRRIREGGRDALDYLSARQSGDGHFRYSKQSDQTPAWVTAQALVPLYGKTYPIAASPKSPSSEQANTAATNGRELQPIHADPTSIGVTASLDPADRLRFGLLPRAVPAPLPTALSIRAPTRPKRRPGHLPRAKCAVGRGPAPPRRKRPNRRRSAASRPRRRPTPTAAEGVAAPRESPSQSRPWPRRLWWLLRRRYG